MKPTQIATDDLTKHLKESMTALRTLRDEVRVELHLAGMEARERWKGLEPRFVEAEKLTREASGAAKQAIDDTVAAFRGFKESLLHAARPPGDKDSRPSQKS